MAVDSESPKMMRLRILEISNGRTFFIENAAKPFCLSQIYYNDLTSVEGAQLRLFGALKRLVSSVSWEALPCLKRSH